MISPGFSGGRRDDPSLSSWCHRRRAGAIAACFSLAPARWITETRAALVTTLASRAQRVRSRRWPPVVAYRDSQPDSLTVARSPAPRLTGAWPVRQWCARSGRPA
jgi:hypothetical protein